MLLLLFSCLINKDLYEERRLALLDQDGDGFRPEDGDCDDGDSGRFPGADELCDDLDNDCDGQIDDDPADAPVWHLDADGDGFGDALATVQACQAPAAHVAQSGDCLDSDPQVHPDAEEACNDGLDNDCDGTDNGCTRIGEWTTDEANAFVFGSAEGDGIGVTLASADLDGDGYADILTGALHGDAAYVVRGRGLPAVSFLAASGGSLTRGSNLSSDTVLAQGVGACDLNGDGWNDALVSGLDWGLDSDLWVFEGPLTTDRSTDEAWARIRSPGGSDFLGNSMACGDIDGDTVPDLLVGSALSNDGAGAAWWIPGARTEGGSLDLSAIGQELPGDVAGMHLGAYLALADLDGDGIVDRIVGATEGSLAAEGGGTVHLFMDRGAAVALEDADAVIVGTEAGGRAGVVAAGDLDGDGRAEVGVGADFVDLGGLDSGAVRVFGGASTWPSVLMDDEDYAWRVLGAEPGDRMGIGLSVVDDILGDSRQVLLASAAFADEYAANGGSAYLFRDQPLTGASGTVADAFWTISGTNAGSAAGYASTGLGDIDQDGVNDLLLGAYGDDTSGTNSGAVFVFFGRGM